jgi:purine-binding chemotaxis protein CheW
MDSILEVKNEKIISYLTFELGNELFASNVSKVLNILELSSITKVPKAPLYMKGVINVRGEVLPVIDTRLKFGMDEAQFTSETCILVLIIETESETIHLGALVDSVQEVLEIEDNDILKTPSIGSVYKSDFIKGVVGHGDKFIMILDVQEVFTRDDLIELKDARTLEINESLRKERTKFKLKTNK